MSTPAVEKRAQELNKLLRARGKSLDKPTRQRIRSLLGEMFAALEARPLDGARCLELSKEIEKELAALSGETVENVGTEAPSCTLKSDCEPPDSSLSCSPEAVQSEVEKSSRIHDSDGPKIVAPRIHDSGADPSRIHDSDGPKIVASRIHDSDAGSSRIFDSDGQKNGDSEGEQNISEEKLASDEEIENNISDNKEKDELKGPEVVGYAQMIHLQIRCFIRVRACVKPAEIGQVAKFAANYGDCVQERVDKFLAVLSKGEDDFTAKVDLETGYKDDLLPDMPDRNLVLRQKRKKKN